MGEKEFDNCAANKQRRRRTQQILRRLGGSPYVVRTKEEGYNIGRNGKESLFKVRVR